MFQIPERFSWIDISAFCKGYNQYCVFYGIVFRLDRELGNALNYAADPFVRAVCVSVHARERTKEMVEKHTKYDKISVMMDKYIGQY